MQACFPKHHVIATYDNLSQSFLPIRSQQFPPKRKSEAGAPSPPIRYKIRFRSSIENLTPAWQRLCHAGFSLLLT
jgi:hypothetical protein